MDFQNGDKGERRIIRKTTVLNPYNSLVHSNLRCIDTKQYSKRKSTVLSSDSVIQKLRRPKNTVNVKCLKLTSSDFKIDSHRQNTKNKENKTIYKTKTYVSKDIILKTNFPNKNHYDTINIKTFGADKVINLKKCSERLKETIDDIQKNHRSIDNKSNNIGLQEMNIEKDDSCTKDAAAKKSAETLSYMKKQRFVRKQDLKNEFIMKTKLKERRKQCLENLQVMTKKILHNNIEKKTRKPLPITNIQEFTESDNVSNLLYSPRKLTHASFEQQFNNQASEIISLDNIEINFDTESHMNTASPDHMNHIDGHLKEKLNSNKKRIKLDKNIIHDTDPSYLYNNCHSDKKKKTDTNPFSELNSSCLAINYPYNLITAVENKLSVTLKSSNKIENEPCLANTSNSTSVNLLPGKDESRNIENQFINKLGSFYGMPNIPGISNISNYNLTENLMKNKSWIKSVDSKKNSFYGVKKVLKNKPQFSSNKNFLSQLQSSLSNLNNENVTVSLEDMLDSKENALCILNDTEIDYTYLKGKPRDILVIAHNTVQFDNKKGNSLDKSETNETSHLVSQEFSNYNICSENTSKSPSMNLVFSKKYTDGMMKVITKNNSNMNQVNSSFRNEVSLLDSFNESLRHIQMVEDTLTSIRKSEDITISQKVVNLSSSKKSIIHANIVENPLLTKLNVFADKYNMYSPMDKSVNNFHNEIRSQNRISYSEDETCGKKLISSKMSIHTTTYKKNNEFTMSDVRDMKRNMIPQEIKLDPSEHQTHCTTSQPEKRSECDEQNEMLLSKKTCGYHKKDAYINNKNTIDHESTENSLVYDSYIETGIEQLPYETSSSFKSLLNNSKDVNPQMLNHLNRFCVFMMSQYMEDEKVRSEYLDLFLKVREKTLMDSTRSEILCLEIQKKYSQEQIPYLKKKQRGLLVKLQQERNEIKNMKKFQHERSNERKDALKRQLKYFKSIFSTDSRHKDIKKPTNTSSVLLHSNSVGRNSPVKAFSLSLNTDTNSHNSSISEMNEIIEKKKQALALQKKKMNDLLLSHYDLRMDAAEIKAIEDRIKDSKTLTNSSDLNCSMDTVVPHEYKTPEKTSRSSNIDDDENCEKEVSSSEISMKSFTIESSKLHKSVDIDIHDPKVDIINTPNNAGMISNIEVNLAASIMSIPCSKKSIDKDKRYESINGSNLNMLWRKITGERVDKYVDSNYYEMSKEKLDNFFERAKHVALQNLLKPKTFDEVKSDNKTSSPDVAIAVNSINVELIGPTEHIVDTVSKPISNLNNGVHYSLKNDMVMPSRSENKKNIKLSSITNYLNHPLESLVDEKCISTELLKIQYENIDNCINDKLSHVKSTTKFLNDKNATNSISPVIENVNASPDHSDSSESTARSLIEELAQFNSMVHMNSSYSKTCDKPTTPSTQGSVVTYAKNETVKNTLQDTDETMLVQKTDESLPHLLKLSKKDHEMTDNTSSLTLKDKIDGNNKSKSCDVKNDSDTANLHHANSDSENSGVMMIDASKKESFGFNQAIAPSFDSELDPNSTLNVIEWNNSNNNNKKQPNHIESCKSKESLIHKSIKENTSDQDDCRMLEQLVSNSSHLQNIMKKQNIETKMETSPAPDSSRSQVCSDEANVSVDKSCSGLHKSDDNSDIKNTRHHDLISNTWDLMLSSPEPSPRDSPTGEYSPATAAFSVSLSRIDEELRKKQLAIELEIKALEQQQTQLPYCLVREIPDKPPPPYIPPLEDTKLPVVTPPKDSPAVAKPIIQVSTAIKSTCNWLWLQYSEERVKNINYTNFDTDVNLSKDNHYSIFLFDLCKETFEKEIDKRKSPTFIWEYKKNNLLKPGKTDICLVVENKVKKFLGLEIWPVKKNLITNWAQKRQDYINELLLKELYKEEINWANIEEVESEVKNTITDTILESLLNEVCKEFHNIF